MIVKEKSLKGLKRQMPEQQKPKEGNKCTALMLATIFSELTNTRQPIPKILD
jgi:hypothetical protein